MSGESVEIIDPRMDDQLVDDTEKDLTIKPIQYEITSYGADIDAEGLVNRLTRGDIFIPPFQRDYVWSQREASRFIESLLLGLPVPGIFLAKEYETKKLLVIDGQQRLKSLQYFLAGVFNPKEGATRQIVFKLRDVQPQFDQKTFNDLSEDNQRTILDSIIHATIVKQDSPKKDQSSIYHIFERLNNSGRKLSPQQIRVAIYHGFAINNLHKYNQVQEWRDIFGVKSKTLKDEELILRFLALYKYFDDYSRPMKDFLNDAMEKFIEDGEENFISACQLFAQTIEYIHAAIGSNAFRPERVLNAAVFDAVMVATAEGLFGNSLLPIKDYKNAYHELLKAPEFEPLISSATADAQNVLSRINMAKKYLILSK